MNIAYFNANLKQGQDGVTRCVYRMMDAALLRGHNVMAVTATRPDSDIGIKVHQVPSIILPLQKSYRLSAPCYRTFAAEVISFRPDIIHLNSPCTLGFAGMKFAHDFDIPVVATYHTHFPSYPRYYGMKRMEDVVWSISRRFYNGMDRTFIPTNPILKEVRDHGIQHLQYLPNGVDETLFNPRHRSDEWRQQFGGGRKPIVLFVSRLVWEKDLRILADAYARLRHQQIDFELVVVGDGHARQEFQAMMPGAHFLGYQSGISLSQAFASSDIFVFPSTTETFGLVTLEAMASGLVPVAADAGGASEIVEDGISGYLALPRNAEALAAKASALLNNPDMRASMKEAAVTRSEFYHWSGILDRLFDSYGETLEQHRRLRRSDAA